jgi:hypothetical protein
VSVTLTGSRYPENEWRRQLAAWQDAQFIGATALGSNISTELSTLSSWATTSGFKLSIVSLSLEWFIPANSR